jgi:hypothetical protein
LRHTSDPVTPERSRIHSRRGYCPRPEKRGGATRADIGDPVPGPGLQRRDGELAGQRERTQREDHIADRPGQDVEDLDHTVDGLNQSGDTDDEVAEQVEDPGVRQVAGEVLQLGQ